MKTRVLLPHRFKWIGLAILLPSIFLGIMCLHQNFKFDFLDYHIEKEDNFFEDQNFTNELAITGVLLGLLFVGFSREKLEDERIAKLRMESIQWGLVVNTAVLLIANWLVYEEFVTVLVYNMFTTLIFFVARFHLLLYLFPLFEKKSQHPVQ